MRRTSSREASGPAMTEAGSPGARWISTNATVATTSATGISASSRRRTSVFTRRRSLLQSDVPEVHLVGRPVALHVLAHRGQAEDVAELHAAHVLVEDRLHLLPHGATLLGIALAGE